MNRTADHPITKAEAMDIARTHLGENLGQTPVPGIPFKRNAAWVVPIDVCYPRMIFDVRTSRPKTRRYLYFHDLAQLEVSAEDGTVSGPKVPTLERLIGDRLAEVRASVEKGLTKVASREFARLHYAAHMTTPLTDLMSMIIMDGEIDTAAGDLRGEDGEEGRYWSGIELLTKVSLVQRQGKLFTPGPAYAELEEKWERNGIRDVSAQLEDSVGYAFAEGYRHYEAIKRVIGPHLNVAGAIYENSIENGKPTAMSLEDLGKVILPVIGEAKAMKLNRYVIQLQEIGLIDVEGAPGERIVVPDPDIYGRLDREDDILAPVKRSIAAAVRT